jgi:Domain of unknown function (DUF4157)
VRNVPTTSQTLRNLAIQRLFNPRAVQAKLTVSQQKEPDEQEAVRVARQIMDMPDSLTGTTGRRSNSAQENDQTLQTNPIQPNFAESMLDESAINSLASQRKRHGNPLPDHVRAYMEPRFGMDFSHVSVHTDTAALRMNRAINAHAFTHGSEIYFGAGHGPMNSELTAHELTHVVQQTEGAPLRKTRMKHVPVSVISTLNGHPGGEPSRGDRLQR